MVFMLHSKHMHLVSTVCLFAWGQPWACHNETKAFELITGLPFNTQAYHKNNKQPQSTNNKTQAISKGCQGWLVAACSCYTTVIATTQHHNHFAAQSSCVTPFHTPSHLITPRHTP
jgi:hypothetical protein